jgi:hypothetical protein
VSSDPLENGPDRATLRWYGVGGAAVVIAIFLVMMAAHVLSASTSAWILALVMLLLLGAGLAIDLSDPRQPSRTGLIVGNILLGVGVIAFLAPPIYLRISGIKANPGLPGEVIGPGEEACIYFNQSITSVKGYWDVPASGGQPNPLVEVTNHGELGLDATYKTLAARSNKDSWGHNIQIGRKESTTRTNTLYAYVKVPSSLQIEGKTMQLRITMTVRYPALQGTGFVDSQQAYTHTASIAVSENLAGSRYFTACFAFFTVGSLSTLAGGIALALTSASATENTTRRRRRRVREEEEEESPSLSDDDEEEEDERPRARRRARDDDEDERPRARRKARDDDEDDPPPPRGRGRDDEDDDRPRARRRPRNDDY